MLIILDALFFNNVGDDIIIINILSFITDAVEFNLKIGGRKPVVCAYACACACKVHIKSP